MARFFVWYRSVFYTITWVTLLPAALGVVASGPPLYAADVLPLEGPPFAAQLASVDNQQFVFLPLQENQSPRVLAADAFVRWSHPVAPRSSTRVILERGDVIVAAKKWTSDGSLHLDKNSLTVITDCCHEIELPRQRVKAVLFGQQDQSGDLESRPMSGDAADLRTDVVYFNNGDRLRATVLRLNGKEVLLQTGSTTRRVSISQVESVVFSRTQLAPPDRWAARLAVGFQEGSLFYANRLRVDDQRFEMVLPGGVQLEGENPEKIVFLQALDGPRLQYLSQTEAADYRHVPYFNIPWPYSRDQNLLGDRLQSNGKSYLTGISAHSASRIVYPLDGRFRRFEAEVALDDVAGRQGSVVFRVYLVRGGELQEVFASKILRGGDPSQAVTVDLEGATHLALVVDYADRGDELDHANWLDARLVK